MFAQVDSLPCSEAERTFGDWNRQRTAQQRGLNVSWHVIQALDRMNVIQVVRDDMVERQLHIRPNVRVCIFVNAQTGGRVLDENVQ